MGQYAPWSLKSRRKFMSTIIWWDRPLKVMGIFLSNVFKYTHLSQYKLPTVE